jgi:hypothetical protein
MMINNNSVSQRSQTTVKGRPGAQSPGKQRNNQGLNNQSTFEEQQQQQQQ